MLPLAKIVVLDPSYVWLAPSERNCQQKVYLARRTRTNPITWHFVLSSASREQGGCILMGERKCARTKSPHRKATKQAARMDNAAQMDTVRCVCVCLCVFVCVCDRQRCLAKVSKREELMPASPSGRHHHRRPVPRRRARLAMEGEKTRKLRSSRALTRRNPLFKVCYTKSKKTSRPVFELSHFHTLNM